jgi:hypothetical protein
VELPSPESSLWCWQMLTCHKATFERWCRHLQDVVEGMWEVQVEVVPLGLEPLFSSEGHFWWLRTQPEVSGWDKARGRPLPSWGGGVARDTLLEVKQEQELGVGVWWRWLPSLVVVALRGVRGCVPAPGLSKTPRPST